MEISTSCKVDAYASEWKGYSDVCALISKPVLPVSLLHRKSWGISRLERQQPEGRKLKYLEGSVARPMALYQGVS